MNVYYQTDNKGLYLFTTPEYSTKPHGCVVVAPPEIPEGKVAIWKTEVNINNTLTYGEQGSGNWVLEDDNRNQNLYLTTTGESYTVSDEADYNGIGPIPEWLTLIPKPDHNHKWDEITESWVVDEVALGADLRRTRDSKLTQTNWLIERHSEQLSIGHITDLTQAQYEDLLVYRQALRDVPAQQGFPNTVTWPTEPTFLNS